MEPVWKTLFKICFCAVAAVILGKMTVVFLPLYTTTDAKIVKVGCKCSLPGVQLTT